MKDVFETFRMTQKDIADTLDLCVESIKTAIRECFHDDKPTLTLNDVIEIVIHLDRPHRIACIVERVISWQAKQLRRMRLLVTLEGDTVEGVKLVPAHACIAHAGNINDVLPLIAPGKILVDR